METLPLLRTIFPDHEITMAPALAHFPAGEDVNAIDHDDLIALAYTRIMCTKERNDIGFGLDCECQGFTEPSSSGAIDSLKSDILSWLSTLVRLRMFTPPPLPVRPKV